MIKNFFFFLFLLLVLASCSNNDDSDKNKLLILSTLKGVDGLSYNESIEKWTELKRVNGNSYIYQTTLLSWVGFGNITEIKVEEGKVTTRVYKEFYIDDLTGERIMMSSNSYTESANEIGSNENGALPLTVDELYNSCVNDYLIVDQENNSIYFETEISGLMTLCGYVPNGCADDCFRGISINSFIWID